jgi:hypothetical protein
MATATRSKRKQMLEEAEEAAVRETNLMQETTDESEADTSYEYESRILSDKSSITIQESDDNVISDISGLSIIIYDDAEIDKQPLLDKKENLQLRSLNLKLAGFGDFFNLMKIILKLFVRLMAVKKCFRGVVLQVQ